MILETYKGFDICREGDFLKVKVNHKEFVSEVPEDELWKNNGNALNKNWRDQCIQVLRNSVDDELTTLCS